MKLSLSRYCFCCDWKYNHILKVSFSVEVSEVPPRASISSDEYVSDDLNFNEECVSPTVPSSDDMTIEEDLPSPTKPKGPTPPPKPKGYNN